jgi:hypothetical protein
MNNNLSIPRPNNFSIASLITTDYYNDENTFYHSMTNPIGSNFHFNHYSIDKTTNDCYPIFPQPDLHSPTLSKTNNEHYQQQLKKRENRSKTNLQKNSTTKGPMEG